MKSKLILLACIVSLCIGKAQTKAETETWIKSVISTHTTGNILFSNGSMTFEDPYDPMGLHFKATVNLKDLAGLKISEGTKGHSALFISCYDGQCVKDSLKGRGSSSFETFLSSKFTIQFTSILSTDLRNRIEKAFVHLIKLNGGKGIDNTF